MTHIKKEITSSDLEKLLSTKNVFPDYMKDIYRKKLKSQQYSPFWVRRIYEIGKQLEQLTKGT